MSYELAFNTGAGPARAAITLVDFDYQSGNTNLNTLSFGPDGTPALLTGTGNNAVKAITAGQISIKSGASQRDLALDIVTGRISG